MSDDTWTDEREIRISSDPESVWAAWAEPEHVRRWFSDDARGELEPGGEIVHRFEGHGEHRYTVVEVDAPHRLVLDGEMGESAFRQVVEIRREGGSTVLRLVHSGFGAADPDDETVQGIDSGWTMALALMKHYVEGFLGRDKTTVAIFRPARFDYAELLRQHYLDGDGLRRWLTSGGAGIDPDQPVSLKLRAGRTLSGSVVALTDHEVSVSWEELDAVLELKAFGSGPDARVLGVRLVSWTEDQSVIDAVRGELERSVERLVDVVSAETS